MFFSIHFREITFKELQNEKSRLEASATNSREEIQMKLKQMNETHEKIEELTVMSKHGFAIASLVFVLRYWWKSLPLIMFTLIYLYETEKHS